MSGVVPFQGPIFGSNKEATPPFRTWVEVVSSTANASRSSSTTANRPTTNLWVGRVHFDTTLGYPIWYDGSGWVNASGVSV